VSDTPLSAYGTHPCARTHHRFVHFPAMTVELQQFEKFGDIPRGLHDSDNWVVPAVVIVAYVKEDVFQAVFKDAAHQYFELSAPVVQMVRARMCTRAFLRDA
jgi:hypothetical protein